MKVVRNCWMMVVLLLCQVLSIEAAAFLSAHEREEIQYRWHLIFDRQLDDLEQDILFVADEEEQRDILWILQRCAVWADRLVHFDDADIQQAIYLMYIVEDGHLWQEFLATRSHEATVAYIYHCMNVLGRMVSPMCELSFPITLSDLDEQLEISGLSESVFAVHVRRAFLAFTFIVSKMSAIAHASPSV